MDAESESAMRDSAAPDHEQLHNLSQGLADSAAKAMELFLDIVDGWEERPVAPLSVHPLAGTLGENGIGTMATLDEFRDKIIPGAIGLPHPMYMGLVNSSSFPIGPLADLLVSALDNNNGAKSQGPSAAEAEDEVVRCFGNIFYGSPDVYGMVLPGGSFANLQGLAMARHNAFPEWSQIGPSALEGIPTIYVSDGSHFSVARAALVLGLGREGIREVPTFGRGSMDPDALRTMIHNDQGGGRTPFAVVATAGTTGTGAIDPIAEILAVCAEEGPWLHVDACYGGSVLLLNELRERFRGIEQADSIATDPHKWFYAPLTASVLLAKDRSVAEEAFRINPSYIPRAAHIDPYRIGIPTSRRASALTIWATLRAHGWSTIRSAVRKDIRLTRLLEELLTEAGFQVLPGGELSIACARWAPDGLSDEEVDDLQVAISEQIIESGLAWFATVRHDDRTWLRLNILNPNADERHVRKAVKVASEVADEISGSSVGKKAGEAV